MPRISENDAYALAQGIDTLDEMQKPRALEILTAYRDQQNDLGEPQWPTHAQSSEDERTRLRGMFKDLKTVDTVAPSITGILPFSENPDADRARVANTAYLASRYGKSAEEISATYDLWKKDYSTRFLQSPQMLDDLAFHKAAGREIQRTELTESATRDGVMAALRGDDIIPSLQTWQQKNGLERMPDSTQFTTGFLNARARAGDHLEFADTLLKQIESNTGLTKGDGAQRPAPASREMAAQFDESLAKLADMKPRDRKQVYAAIGAKAEAAGYDPKGFWGQMLSYAGKQMARVGDTTSAAVSDLASAGAVAGDGIEGGAVSPDAMARFQSGVDTRGKRGVVYDELADIVARDVDPVKPVIGWLNDSVETGLIKGPGAIAPFMMASAALGPLGGGALFTADFAEQNRRDLVRSGLDDSDARLIGMAAAPIQAAVESLSNGMQLGRFPAVQRALAGLTKPIAGGAGMVTRYGLNSMISLGSEFTEEQLQDNVIRPAVQNVVAAFDEDVPEIGMGKIWENIKASTPELLFTLAPMALVFGGTMTAAQANLSKQQAQNRDLLQAEGFSAAQANEIASLPTLDASVKRSAELWGARAGTPASMETAAKSVAERMRMLQTDHIAAQQDLEQRGILPRMLRATDDKWRLTFNDGSTADFNSHQEADAARWQWSSDQLGKVHTAVQRTLSQMEKGADVGREFALQFSPDERHVTPDEMASKDFQDRVKQGELLDEVQTEHQYSDAVAIDKASGGDVVQKILGSSVNTFKDGVLTTTMRLYYGADITTLVEEKLEGDAKAIMADADGRQWMLDHMRNYEQASGDKLFVSENDAQVTDKQLAEAWSHLGQSYLVGKSTDAKAWQGKTARRLFNYVLNAGLSPVMNAETQYWRAVAIRAQRVVALQKEGKLGNDLAATLEKQLGIDSQAKHENEAAKEAESIANEALNVGGASYSEENPGPNGETFSAKKFTFPSLAGAAESVRGMKQAGKVIDFPAIYAAAKIGQSSYMLSLNDLYQQAKQRMPAITEAQFGKQMQALYNSGQVLLEPGDQAASMKAALDKYGLRDSLGIPSMYASPMEGETLSLRSGDFSARMSAAFSPFQRSPELRMRIGMVAKARLMKAAADKMTDFGPGKQYVTQGLESLLESKGWIENRADELVNQWLDGLTTAARMDYESGLQSIEDHPLIQEMRGQGLLIMRRATALNKGINIVDGKEAGDYNGMPALPASLMARPGYGMLPGNIADAISKAAPGLVKDGHADSLFDALSSVIRDVENRNDRFKAVNDQLKAQKKTALAQAKLEAPASPEYNAEQRQKMKALIRVLDGVLSAVDPTVRAKVGSFANVLDLNTDAKMMNFIERRIEKLNVELEKWLKKEGTEQIDKLLEKNKSTRGKKGAIEGKTTAETTERIDYAAKVREMTLDEQEKELRDIEGIIADPKSTQEKADEALSRLGIVELFYDFDEQDAASLTQVYDWLQTTIKAGRDVKNALAEDRKNWMQSTIKAAVKSVLGKETSSEADANNRRNEINGSVLKSALENVKGAINTVLPTAAQQLEDVFGQDSDVVKQFTKRIWRAANESTDIKREVEKQRKAMLARVFGGSGITGDFAHIQALARLQQPKKSGVFIIEGRKVEKVKIPVDVLERLADGSMSAKAAGLTTAEVKQALEQFAASSTRTRSATIEKETFPGEQKELEMSEMQALNYWLSWNQAPVRKRMEYHGWSDESAKQLQAFLSPEARQIGAFMVEMYSTAGRSLVDPVYRRIYSAPLPNITNYAPTAYNVAGNDNTLSLEDQHGGSGIMASFTKGRRAHNNSVKLADALTVFLSHFEHVAHWVSHVELLRDMKAIVASNDVQYAVITKSGPAAASALVTRIKSLEAQGNNQAWGLHAADSWVKRLNQARAYKGLAFRLSPIIKQTSALFNPLLADVPAHAYAIGLAKLLTGKLDYSSMMKSDVIRRRIEGGFSAEARLAMQAAGKGPIGETAIHAMQLGMMPMQYTDAGWTAAGAAIAYDYYKGRALKAGQNEAMAEQSAADAVDDMITVSAQPADLSNRSMIEGSPNPFVKMVWMFASESRKTLAIEFYAAKRLMQGKSKNKAMDAQRIVVAHVVMGLTTQLMASFLALIAGNDDDKDRELSAAEWGAALVAGPINGLFVLGDGINYAIRSMFGAKVFQSKSAFSKLFEDAYLTTKNIDDLFEGDSTKMIKEIHRLSSSLGNVMSLFFGPAAQAPDVILGNPLQTIERALE